MMVERIMLTEIKIGEKKAGGGYMLGYQVKKKKGVFKFPFIIMLRIRMEGSVDQNDLQNKKRHLL